MAAGQKNKYGQYFTPLHVAQMMLSLYTGRPAPRVLEPCCGEGVFLQALADRGYQDVSALEVDPALTIMSPYPVRRESFVSASFPAPFDLIIGNPPYIRWKHLEDHLKEELTRSELWQRYCNSLCDYATIFILKAASLLAEGGQLIFITPEYWLTTKHAQGLRDYLAEHGYLEVIYHFRETPIFEGVAASIVIFKFVKSQAGHCQRPLVRLVRYEARRRLDAAAMQAVQQESAVDLHAVALPPFTRGAPWLLASVAEQASLARLEQACHYQGQRHTLQEMTDIGNGMVSGLDKAFQLPPDLALNTAETAATLRVIKAHQLLPYRAGGQVRYLHLSEDVNESVLQQQYPAFHAHLQPFREQLLQRYNYGHRLPYWQWAFKRSQSLFARPQPRIFVPCKERISHKQYFRFAWVPAGIYPTQDVTAILLKPGVRESLPYLLAWLNSPFVFDWLRIKGVIKGNIVEFSEKPLASIPVRRINWQDPFEVAVHEKISKLVEKVISGAVAQQEVEDQVTGLLQQLIERALPDQAP